MSDIKRFLELVNQEIYFGDVSEEFEILFETLSERYSCNDFAPEKIKERIRKNIKKRFLKRISVVRFVSKNLLQKVCFIISKSVMKKNI